MNTGYEVGRFEFKYLLPVEQRPQIIEIIEPYVVPDSHSLPLNDDRLGYEVHSLYLDTPDLDDYHDRLAEKKTRTRLRIRTYGPPSDDQPVFLENKRKSGRWVVKHRVSVGDVATWLAVDDPRPWTRLSEAIEGRGRYTASSFCQLVNDGGRGPVSSVHYEREVFVPKSNGHHHIRLTLDSNIKAARTSSASRLHEPPEIALVPPEFLVMELKFDSVAPLWMKQLCREMNLLPTPVSKYGLSIARSIRLHKPHELDRLMPRLASVEGCTP